MRIVTRAPTQKGRGSRPSATRRDYPSPYFTLSCDHLSTIEEQLVWSAWRTSQHKYYCEPCGKWRELKPKPKPLPMPDEPMF